MKKSVEMPLVPQRRRRPKGESAEGNSTGTRNNEQYYSRTLGRALDVLEAFRADRPALSMKDLSMLVNLPESSLFRVLITLHKHGYLVQSSDGTYQLSPKVLFGRLSEGAEALRQIVRPHLQSLASRFNETASLAYLFEDRIQVLDTVETFHEIRVINRTGRILPPHCSSMGKAITAYQNRDIIDRMLETYGLTKRTDKTIVDRHRLLSELENVQLDGFATDREESTVGGVCIGAPIFQSPGRVVAAISVSTPIVRMTPQKEHDVKEAVKFTSEKISKDLQKTVVEAVDN